MRTFKISHLSNFVICNMVLLAIAICCTLHPYNLLITGVYTFDYLHPFCPPLPLHLLLFSYSVMSDSLQPRGLHLWQPAIQSVLCIYESVFLLLFEFFLDTTYVDSLFWMIYIINSALLKERKLPLLTMWFTHLPEVLTLLPLPFMPIPQRNVGSNPNRRRHLPVTTDRSLVKGGGQFYTCELLSSSPTAIFTNTCWPKVRMLVFFHKM